MMMISSERELTFPLASSPEQKDSDCCVMGTAVGCGDDWSEGGVMGSSWSGYYSFDGRSHSWNHVSSFGQNQMMGGESLADPVMTCSVLERKRKETNK